VIWFSRDGGFVLERLTEDPNAEVEEQGETILVRAHDAAFRITRDGPSS
jgi:hypothetical protein